jgi:hypothetical protein
VHEQEVQVTTWGKVSASEAANCQQGQTRAGLLASRTVPPAQERASCSAALAASAVPTVPNGATRRADRLFEQFGKPGVSQFAGGTAPVVASQLRVLA